MKTIAILGSTGSVGTQALEVLRANPGQFCIYVLTSNISSDLLISQALEFKPVSVIIADESHYQKVKTALAHTSVKVFAGHKAIADCVLEDEIDVVLTALVGYAGLLPTLNAIRKGKRIALANKETLVVAGQLVTDLAKQYGAQIIPVDSEHSAIFQCLQGEPEGSVEKLILTASGGPFRGLNRDVLHHVTPEQALKHPNWSMGAKITIDSASLMNKGLEIIEAKWLFNIPVEQIEVVIHPQSVIHSMVQFHDGSVKAQMGVPDMKLPIQYALAYPDRLKNKNPRYDFLQSKALTFEEPDPKTFRNLALAVLALKKGGNLPCVINAANEIVVAGFLSRRIGFLAMSDVIERCMDEISFVGNPAYDDYVSTDSETRKLALSLI